MRGPLKLLFFAFGWVLLATALLRYLEKADLPATLPHLEAELLFIQPEDGRAPLIKKIKDAKETILVKLYLFSDSSIIKELIKAKARGMDVRVILERSPYGESRVNQRTKKKLEEGGVKVRWGPKRFALMHEKTIIIDRKELIIMTSNLCRSAFKKNREYAIAVSCPRIVDEAIKIFEADWKGKFYLPRGVENLVVSPENAKEKILHLIGKAKKRIWVKMLLIEDKEIINALRGARERGVDVKVLLANPLRVEVNKKVKELLHGCSVRFLYRPFLHAKFIDFDGEVLFIGSQNLSAQSLEENRECGLLITSQDIVVKLEEVFKEDWEDGISRY
jgi:phosphatidylserine/phosphatidylglycerophosphate/cardiolipin synthase-like enzyme